MWNLVGRGGSHQLVLEVDLENGFDRLVPTTMNNKDETSVGLDAMSAVDMNMYKACVKALEHDNPKADPEVLKHQALLMANVTKVATKQEAQKVGLELDTSLVGKHILISDSEEEMDVRKMTGQLVGSTQ